MSLRLSQPKVFLPMLMFVSVLMIGLRVNDVWDSLNAGKGFQPVKPSIASSAPAEEAAKPAKPEAPPLDFDATRKDDNEEAAEEIDPSILKQLKERRSQLDARAAALESREVLVKVAEQRLEQKLQEMETLRTQLQSMVNSANAAQQAQLENLVKIYETMKAKEASKIFEALEMPTLLGVIERMKPAKVAAIMAEMPPEKAKEITMALTRKDQLPQIK